jgi:hypothetical protein
MTFRFAAFFLLVSAVLIASPAALRGMATDGPAAIAVSRLLPPNDITNPPSIEAGNPIVLAATEADINACKQACADKFRCKKDQTVGADPVLKACLKEAKACKVACSN